MTFKQPQVQNIGMDKLVLWTEANVRKTLAEKNIDELAENIKENGLQSPLLVKKDKDRYLVFAGQRRLTACSIIGMKQIPCFVYPDIDLRDARMLSLSENLHRLPMEDEDKFDAVALLVAQYGDKHKAAKSLGVTVQTIYNYLGFTGLPDEIKEAVNDGKITSAQGLRIYRKFPVEKALKVAKLLADIPSSDRGQKQGMYAAIVNASREDDIARIQKRGLSMASAIKYVVMIPKTNSKILEDLARLDGVKKEDIALDMILEVVEKRERGEW